MVFASMLALSGTGAVVASLRPDHISSLAGALAFYLTATGWAAAGRRYGRVGPFEAGGLVYAITLAFAGLVLGALASTSPDGKLEGQPYQAAFGFAAVAALGAAGDLWVILRGGITGSERIARHLWRTAAAVAITAASFAAQPKAQPELLMLAALALPLLAATIWPIIRIRVPSRRGGSVRAAPAGAAPA